MLGPKIVQIGHLGPKIQFYSYRGGFSEKLEVTIKGTKLKLNSLSSWQANTLSTGGQGGKEGHPPPGQN